MNDYEKLRAAYDPDERRAPCPDEDASTCRAVEINFAIPVEVTQDQQRRLVELISEIVDSPWNQPKEGVHWPAEFGSKPHWSKVDAAMLGIPAERGAPASGEPTFDDSVFAIGTCAREFASEKERLKNNGCVWCGKLEEEHGPSATVLGYAGLLCPVPGVTSQFYTPKRSLRQRQKGTT